MERAHARPPRREALPTGGGARAQRDEQTFLALMLLPPTRLRSRTMPRLPRTAGACAHGMHTPPRLALCPRRTHRGWLLLRVRLLPQEPQK
jgi:hypothetical protein